MELTKKPRKGQKEVKRPRGYQPSWEDVFALIEENPDGMSLEDIGKVFGMTRERVRQIEVGALAKIKAGGEVDFTSWAEHKPGQTDNEHTIRTGNRVQDEPPDDVSPAALTMSPRSQSIERAIQGLEASVERYQDVCEPFKNQWLSVPLEALDKLAWVALHSEQYGKCEILHMPTDSDWWLVRLPYGPRSVVHKDNFVQDFEVQAYVRAPKTLSEAELNLDAAQGVGWFAKS